MRRSGRVDDNQAEIVRALRGVKGCMIVNLAPMGHGCPDLLVGYRGINYLLEVKDGEKAPSRQRLTDDERRFHRLWPGQVAIVNCVGDALGVVGAQVYGDKGVEWTSRRRKEMK